jgi:glycosyltransferase involved in cell wall biosynthesis
MSPTVLHVTTVPVTFRFLVGHVAYAKRKGFDVHVMSSPGEALDRFAREMQVECHPIAMPRRITPLEDLGALVRVARAIRRIHPTIVDGHTPKGGLLAMMAATLCRVPVRIYHLHGLPLVTATGLKRTILRCTEWTACTLAHQVLSVSESLRHVAIAEGLCRAEKIKVLGHGTIDGVEADATFDPTRMSLGEAKLIRDRYQIPHDALVVGFVGRIVRDKGLIELVRAWRTLREEFASAHLLVAGPFEDQDPVPAEVEAELRGDPRVHLAGMVHDMPSIYRVLDLLVLPTYREGFGVALLEAAAMSVPVVASRIPGCVDAVQDGVTGTLVPARDADALAMAVRTYLRDSDLRVRHGRQGRERVLRDFNPKVMRDALCQEYERLLRERTNARFRPAGAVAGANGALHTDHRCSQE